MTELIINSIDSIDNLTSVVIDNKKYDVIANCETYLIVGDRKQFYKARVA